MVFPFTIGASSSPVPVSTSSGFLFLYSLSSALLGGVGRDAKHIVDHIVSTRPARIGNSWPEREEVMADGE